MNPKPKNGLMINPDLVYYSTHSNYHNALSFLKELGNPYEFIAKDSDGSVSVLFGVYGIPESILINNEQKIIKKFIGPINQSHYKELVQIIN